MQGFDADSLTKTLEDLLPVIQQVNRQLKDPVSKRRIS